MLLLVTLVTFMVVSAIVLSGYYVVSAETAVEQRLRQLAPAVGVSRPRQVETERRSVLRQLIAGLGRYGVTGNERSLTHMLTVAGFRGGTAPMLFLGTRTLVSFGPALMLLVPQVSAGKPLGSTLWHVGLVWGFGHMMSNLWLRRRARQRSLDITTALPDSLDLMVVCLEAGLSLNATIARVGEERSAMDDPLGVEFSQVARELKEGRGRDEALHALGERNGADDLRSLAGLIVQSDRLGASMAQTLRAHADVLRTKRRQRAEEMARKLPIKMLFPLAMFILPALLVVATGPALLRIGEMVKVVSGRH